MNLLELKNQLKQKEYNNLYILHGKEYTILEMYIQKIIDGLGFDVYSTESVSSIASSLDKKDILSSGAKVYVIRDDKEFVSKEALWKDLEQKLRKKKIYLILKYSSVDGRSKFYKRFENAITEFCPLSEDVLVKYIQKDIDLRTDYAKYLCKLCGNDYGRIKLEIDKIRCYCKEMGKSCDESFVICGKSGLFYKEPEGQAFDLVDAFLERNPKTLFDLLQESVARKDNPLMILALLHTNMKNLLQYKLAQSCKDITQATGMNGFQIKKCSQFASNYTIKQLVRALKYIKYCERSVKQGTLPSEMMLDYLVVNIL